MTITIGKNEAMDTIATDQICFIISTAREFEAEGTINETYADVGEEDEEPKQQDFEDRITARQEDPLYSEIIDFIGALNVDQQCKLVALAWLGRGDYTVDEWVDAVKIARERHNNATAEYLLGMPLLPDYLQEGLSAFNLSCE